MNTPLADRLHDDPSNWVLGFLYVARADRRLVVPKRLRLFGWTLNFARPLAVPLLLAVLAVFLVPVALVRSGAISPAVAIGLEVVLAGALAVLCLRLANRRNA